MALSLLARTYITLALTIATVSWAVEFFLTLYVIEPLSGQLVDIEAALIVLTAQTWVELPPESRSAFEVEMARSHGVTMRVNSPVPSGEPLTDLHLMLKEKLLSRLPPGSRVVLSSTEEMLWSGIPMGGHQIQVGVSSGLETLSTRIRIISITVFLAGIFAVFAAASLLVRYMGRPLAAAAQAARKMGSGEASSLPVTGPAEFRTLAQSFNKMTEQVAELLENRTTILIGISHDLRTPLARIRLAAEFIEGKENEDAVKRISRNLETMDKMLSAMLRFARLRFAQEESESKQEDLRVEEICDELTANRKILKGQSLRLDLRVPSSFVVRGAREALVRILDNLLENASIHGGQHIVLRVAVIASELVFSVIDDGPGIPEEQRKKIFEPFVRLEESRGAGPGNGLGLAIVKQLCQSQEWSIEVGESSTRGCVFELKIPLSGSESWPWPPRRRAGKHPKNSMASSPWFPQG